MRRYVVVISVRDIRTALNLRARLRAAGYGVSQPIPVRGLRPVDYDRVMARLEEVTHGDSPGDSPGPGSGPGDQLGTKPKGGGRAMKPLRDWPALVAYFAMLGVALGGIVFDRYVLHGSDFWAAWAFLLTIAILGLTGIDPTRFLPSRRNGGPTPPTEGGNP